MKTIITTEVTASISNKFSELIKKNEYESIVCELMNLSKRIFPGHYQWIERQDSGECDFIEVDNKTKFDAKLPFNKEQGKLIGSRKHDYKKWVEIMLKEISEFNNNTLIEEKGHISNTEIYGIILDRLKDVEADENVIFFFPFPIVNDIRGSIFSQFCSDILDDVYTELERNNEIKGRNIYVIYLTSNRDIVLRRLGKIGLWREYIKFPKLNEYIFYQEEYKDYSQI